MTKRPEPRPPAPAGSGADTDPSRAAIDAAIDAAIAENRDLRGATLPILHAIQDRLGYVPPAALDRIAKALNLSRADVHGVLTFYHDFRTSPPGRHVLKLCRAEACQAMGSEALAETLKSLAGTDFGSTSPDAAVTIENVYCLGNCACSPALMLDGSLEGRVTAGRLEEIVAEARAGK